MDTYCERKTSNSRYSSYSHNFNEITIGSAKSFQYSLGLWSLVLMVTGYLMKCSTNLCFLSSTFPFELVTGFIPTFVTKLIINNFTAFQCLTTHNLSKINPIAFATFNATRLPRNDMKLFILKAHFSYFHFI